MEVLRFVPELHYEELRRWAELRNITPTPLSLLPKIGRIVPGKAAIFLYKTDSALGLLDNLISNPEALDTSAAIDAVVLAALADGKSQGIQAVMSTTKHAPSAARAQRLGFDLHPSNFHVLTKRL